MQMPPECFRGYVLGEDVCSVVIAADLDDCYDVGLYELLYEKMLDGYMFCFL